MRGPQPQAKSILLQDDQKKTLQQCSSKTIPEEQLAIQNELPTSTFTQVIAAYCNLTHRQTFKSYFALQNIFEYVSVSVTINTPHSVLGFFK